MFLNNFKKQANYLITFSKYLFKEKSNKTKTLDLLQNSQPLGNSHSDVVTGIHGQSAGVGAAVVGQRWRGHSSSLKKPRGRNERGKNMQRKHSLFLSWENATLSARFRPVFLRSSPKLSSLGLPTTTRDAERGSPRSCGESMKVGPPPERERWRLQKSKGNAERSLEVRLLFNPSESTLKSLSLFWFVVDRQREMVFFCGSKTWASKPPLKPE